MGISNSIKLNHASVCSGIGGAEIAAQWAGWENIFHCEKNPFGRKILDYYYPKSKSYEDLTTTDFRLWRGKVDVFTAGFPCQPFSTAGKRRGTEDDRHLWPHVIRAIREIRPRWIVGENVRGFTNWGGGMVFDQVLSDLEAEGYEILPFLLPACAVNAPHRRDRIWIIAFNTKCKPTGRHDTGKSERIGVEMERNKLDPSRRNESADNFESSGANGSFIDSNHQRRSDGLGEIPKENGEVLKWHESSKSGNADKRPTAHTNNNGHPSPEIRQSDRERNDDNETRQKSVIESKRCGSQADVAHSDQFNGYLSGLRTSEISQQQTSGIREDNVTNTDSQQRPEGRMHQEGPETAERYSGSCDSWEPRRAWENFPTQPPVCGGNDGLSSAVDLDSIFKQLGIEHPRQPSIGYAKWRNESIKGYGNAWVPELPYQIFESINQYELLIKK